MRTRARIPGPLFEPPFLDDDRRRCRHERYWIAIETSARIWVEPPMLSRFCEVHMEPPCRIPRRGSNPSSVTEARASGHDGSRRSTTDR